MVSGFPTCGISTVNNVLLAATLHFWLPVTAVWFGFDALSCLYVMCWPSWCACALYCLHFAFRCYNSSVPYMDILDWK